MREPRVSDAVVDLVCRGRLLPDRMPIRVDLCCDLRDVRAERATLRAKLAEVEWERDEARANAERLRNRMYAVEEQSLRHLQRADKIYENLSEERAARRRAEAALAQALDALKPFADDANNWSPAENDGYVFDDDHPVSGNSDITVGDLRRAKAALNARKEG